MNDIILKRKIEILEAAVEFDTNKINALNDAYIWGFIDMDKYRAIHKEIVSSSGRAKEELEKAKQLAVRQQVE